MQIRCEKCKTEYALDEKLLSPKGTPVRCTQCGCVFKAYPQSVDSDNTPAGGSPNIKWTLKKKSGEVDKFGDTPRLQMFISEGNASGEDTVSKYGGPWKAVADVAELQSFLSTDRPSVQPRGQGVTAQAKNSLRQPTMAGAAAKVSEPASSKKPINIRAIPSQRNTDPPPALSGPNKDKQPGFAASPRKPPSSANPKKLEVGKTLLSNATPPAAKKAPVTKKSPKNTLETEKTLISSNPPPATKNLPKAPSPKDSPATQSTEAERLVEGKTIRSSLVMGETVRATGPMPATSKNKASEPDNQNPNRVDSPNPLLDGDTIHANEPSVMPEAVSESVLQTKEADEPDFSQVPVVHDEEDWSHGEQDVDDEEPDWTNAPTTMSSIPADPDHDLGVPRKSKSVFVAITVIILLLGGVAGYLYVFEKDLLISQFGEVQDSKKEKRQNTLLIEAREKVLLDTLTDYAQAEKKYLQVLAIDANNPKALAALAQMYAVWAQYLLDAHLDAQSDLKEDNSNAAAADQLKKEFETKLGEAKRRQNQALKVAPNLSQAHIAAAEIELLQGNVTGAKKHLALGRSEDTLQGASYISAQIGLFENENKAEIIGMLKSIVVADPLLRVLYRLARIQAADGRKDDALTSIEQILELNKKHTAALELKQRLSGEDATPGTIQLLPAQWVTTEDTDSDSASESENSSKKAATGSNTVARKSDNADEQKEEMSTDRMLQKATIAQKRGRTQEAADLYNRVLRESPSNVDALNGLAYTFLDRGNNGQAIAKFRRALGVSPQFGPSIIGMAQAYKSMGQKKEALKWYEKYLAAFPGGRDAGMAQRNVTTLRIDIENDAPGDNEGAASDSPVPAATPAPATPVVAPPVEPKPPPTPSPSPEPIQPTSPSVETPQ